MLSADFCAVFAGELGPWKGSLPDATTKTMTAPATRKRTNLTDCGISDLDGARDHPSGAHTHLYGSDDSAMTTKEEYDLFGWEPGFEARKPEAREPDLLRQSRLVFVHDLKDDERLRHRMLGELGAEVGTVAEEGTGPQRFWKLKWRSGKAPVRVAVYDETGGKVVEFLRPRADAKRNEIADGAGRVLGALVMEKRKRRPLLEDAAGQPVATFTRKRRLGTLDYTIVDAVGLEVARIRDSSADELDGLSRWLQLTFRASRQHTLELNREVTSDQRLMLLATVAGLYLAFETPPADQSD